MSPPQSTNISGWDASSTRSAISPLAMPPESSRRPGGRVTVPSPAATRSHHGGERARAMARGRAGRRGGAAASAVARSRAAHRHSPRARSRRAATRRPARPSPAPPTRQRETVPAARPTPAPPAAGRRSPARARTPDRSASDAAASARIRASRGCRDRLLARAHDDDGAGRCHRLERSLRSQRTSD